jgi:phosphatidylserine decarboxylase
MRSVRINRAGWPFIAIAAVLALALAQIAEPLGWIGAVVTAWCAYFFRDPERTTPTRPGLVVSPADGLVLPVTTAVPPPELEMGEAALTRVSIFMDIFDVHVNRIPADGVLKASRYRPGKFFNASFDKASIDNERRSFRLALPDGREIAFVQIAGLVARRIRCDVAEGQAVQIGERFGLIRFGSRVDVFLPAGVSPLVVEGQRTLAGETVIADLNHAEPPRVGVRR